MIRKGKLVQDVEEEPSGRGGSKHEDPEAGMNLMCLKDRKKASVCAQVQLVIIRAGDRKGRQE